jgi:outer membrane lipoprotein-sorting protein
MKTTFAFCVWLAAGLTLTPAAQAAPPTAEQVLDRLDHNLTFQARRTRMVMTVEGRRTRTYEMVSYGRGEEDAAVEYIAPARDKGTRMLKLGDELWIYLPAVDKCRRSPATCCARA